MESLNKLEDKIREMVSNLELLKKENEKLKKTINEISHEHKLGETEKEQIKKKVTALIGLIDSIKNEE